VQGYQVTSRRNILGETVEVLGPEVVYTATKPTEIDRTEGSERPDGHTADEVHRELAARMAAATKRAKRRERRQREARAGGWN
jgi:hypothetical protein